MFKFIRKKIIEGIIKDIIKDLPKYKVNALAYFDAHKEEIIEKLVEFVQKEITKKIAIFVGVMILGLMPVYAEEQLQEAKDIKGAIVIKKQPTQEQATQIQRVEKVYGSIVIFVQGKTPFDKTENK